MAGIEVWGRDDGSERCLDRVDIGCESIGQGASSDHATTVLEPRPQQSTLCDAHFLLGTTPTQLLVLEPRELVARLEHGTALLSLPGTRVERVECGFAAAVRRVAADWSV